MKKQPVIQCVVLLVIVAAFACVGYGLEGHFRALYPMDREDAAASTFYVAIYVIENAYALLVMGLAAAGLWRIFGRSDH
ncbi:hypothetical protein [Lacticaseibacillus parakribbianus]|uniref:hypothetical protein n=1 Tax=Lacticaseibacillus parakribbianus TaxID=2970927 RepID=UPI0021CB7C59|nr:hypothetical protein [Lacticaseibacillus parakribbianus]